MENLKIKECKNKNKWDQFISTSPQGNIFSKTCFLDALSVQYELWLIENNKELVGGAVILKGENKVLQQQYPFSMYQGIFFSDLWQKLSIHKRPVWQAEIMQFLLDQLTQHYSTLSFCLHYSLDDLREIQWFNYHMPEMGQFQLNLRYTGIIDLNATKNIEEYLLSIRKTRRNEYRQASRNLTVEKTKNIKVLDQLHQLTFERQGIQRTKEEVSLLKSITSAALKKNFGELLVCLDSNKKPASATLFLYDNHCGYYLFGANDPDYRKSNSGVYLFIENIKKSKERGINNIDVCGINSPNRGDFKTSLNAKPIPYFIATWQKPK